MTAGFPEADDAKWGAGHLGEKNVVHAPTLSSCNRETISKLVTAAQDVTNSWTDDYGNIPANIGRGLLSPILNQPCTKAFQETIAKMLEVVK